MRRKPRALDLNRPKDARAYVKSWVDSGNPKLSREQMLNSIQFDSDDEYLLLARQLFLYADPRVAPESYEGAH
jgi:hypothetical protein